MPKSASAECGYDRVSVSGTIEEVAVACQALKRVLSYFVGIGFEIEPEFSPSFHERVEISVYNPSHESSRALQVSGFYDNHAHEIRLTSANSAFQEGRSPWGIAWGSALATSILEHELVHMTVAAVLSAAYYRFGHRADEPHISRRGPFTISSQWTLRSPEVNSITYHSGPFKFGVKSYRHTQANDGRDFIRRILVGKVDFSTGEPGVAVMSTELSPSS